MGGPGYSGRGWMVQILPQMEEQPKYDAIMAGLKTKNGKINWVDPPFSTVGYGMGTIEIRPIVQTQIPWLSCPSDLTAVPSNLQFHWKPILVATSSYKGVIGDDVVWPQATTWQEGSKPDCHNIVGACNGLFWRTAYFKPLKLKDIIDGQSKTFMVGECVVGQDFHSAALFADGDWASANVPLNYFLPGGAEQDIIDKWYEVRGFRSYHPGGAQFVMADGSVHFVEEGIDGAAYRAMATRNGGESTPSIN